MTGILETKNIEECFYPILLNIRELISMNGCCIFIMDHNYLPETNLSHLSIQKVIIENKYINAICLNDTEVQAAYFKRLKDGDAAIYTKSHLCQPIMDLNNKTIAIIQVEAKYRTHESSMTKLYK